MADLKRKMEEDSDLVTFVVGGVTFVLKKDVIDQYPDSFLANIIKPKWRHNEDEPIVIKRDGTLFQYIYDYLRYGALPRDKSGQLMVDASTKAEILQEADFFQLGGLVKECLQEDGYQIGYYTQWLLYNGFKETIKHCKNGKYLGGGGKRKWVVPGDVPDTPRHRNTITRTVPSQTSSETYLAFTKLLRQITAPCCMHGKVDAKDLSGMNVPNVSKSVDERRLKEWLANTTSENTFYSAVHPTTKRRVFTAGAEMLRSADEAQKQKVIEGMHEQLRGFDSAVICLQHLYPACQANPDFLKGGDQLLYNILRDHFTLAVL
eukprot:gene26206-29600_t